MGGRRSHYIVYKYIYIDNIPSSKAYLKLADNLTVDYIIEELLKKRQERDIIIIT
jgi:hypothetical protein